jgi:hypothetical protein
MALCQKQTLTQTLPTSCQIFRRIALGVMENNITSVAGTPNVPDGSAYCAPWCGAAHSISGVSRRTIGPSGPLLSPKGIAAVRIENLAEHPL